MAAGADTVDSDAGVLGTGNLSGTEREGVKVPVATRGVGYWQLQVALIPCPSHPPIIALCERTIDVSSKSHLQRLIYSRYSQYYYYYYYLFNNVCSCQPGL